MNIWDILEIEQTADRAIIKKAYARKLKIYHPEDDPEGFQKLREAYDRALKYAKINAQRIESYVEDNKLHNKNYFENEIQNEDKSNVEKCRITIVNRLEYSLDEDEYDEDEFDEDEYDEDEYDEDEYDEDGFDEDEYDEDEYDELEYDEDELIRHRLNFILDYPHEQPVEEQTDEQKVNYFIRKLRNLYQDTLRRFDEKNWEELLQDDILEDLNCKLILQDLILTFLKEHPSLPRNIWRKLAEIFYWKEEERFLAKKGLSRYIFKQLSNDPLPRYTYFEGNTDSDCIEYLEYRDKIVISLLTYHYYKANEYIELAQKMNKKDPDLLCLIGAYYLKTKQNKKVKAVFLEAIKLNPYDWETYLYQAQIMYENKGYQEAVFICNQIDDALMKYEVRTLKGKCYAKMTSWRKAIDILKQNMEINPCDEEIKKFLIDTAHDIKIYLKSHPHKFKYRKMIKEIYCITNQTEKLKEVKLDKEDKKKIIDRLFVICSILYFIRLLFVDPIRAAFFFSLFMLLLVIRVIQSIITYQFRKNKS
ncbi:J domain-containing protein [Anaeromicropila herbilytica]|uniref:J domain-containing protein n=1 Tax=Anaeromicropila herbilytica TaxID=2785025 RepID=A0A7R7EPD5_9FIRM|nr:J domain-containing protein [Anaeromicropila herbilytica]BCN32326.1 hypothetical protein bsdtb5_36210 [Anaeromicropila herbilytica]